ncbi:MAG: hypothetical protein GY953_32270, partial [bacterium]|nr:hypothetical protein [bacterium]
NWAYIAEGASGLTRFVALHSTLLDAGRLLGTFTGFAAVMAMAAVVVRNYRMVTDPDERRRIQWVVYAAFVGLAPLVWWSVVSIYEQVIGPPPVPLLALAVDAATVAFPISVAYAVVKHRVFDIKVALRLGVQYLLARRALQFLFAFPVAALVYTVVVNRDRTIAELLTGSKGYLYWMAAAGLSLKFRRPLRQWLDRKFFRSEYDREQVLLGVLDELGKLGSISEMSRLVSEQLELSLHPKTV